MIAISLWGGTDASSIAAVTDRVAAAHAQGFGGIWFPQTLAFDTITALAVAGSIVGDIALGTAVVPIQGRHPIPLALQALTAVDSIGPGRFSLGVGVTHAVVAENWFGISYGDSVRLADEELQALSGLLGAGRASAVAGEMLTARVTLPSTVAAPSLMVAALGPKMLALTGRHADGTITWMTGRHTLATRVVPQLTDAAAAAGRGAPRVVVGLPVCVTNDVADARDRVRPAMLGAAQMPSYARQLAAEGVDDPTEIAIIGSDAQVRDHIEQLAAAGATELMANVVGDPDEVARTRALLAAL
jgi:5,10-methylenetetrahydromethanopterin reductase